jgi:hypothetical protein
MRSSRPWICSIIGLLTGCHLPSMQVAPTLASGAQRPVELETFGTGNHVRFGPFHVASVDRTAFERSGGSISSVAFPDWVRSVSNDRQHQDYEFALEEDGQPARRTVRCRAEMDRDSIETAGGSLSRTMQRLHCGLWFTADPARFARLDFSGGQGTVELGGRRFTIEARGMRGEADEIDPAGYAVSEAGHDLGAVQVVNSGGAWIAPGIDADTRALVATAEAALFLYRAPSP